MGHTDPLGVVEPTGTPTTLRRLVLSNGRRSAQQSKTDGHKKVSDSHGQEGRVFNVRVEDLMGVFVDITVLKESQEANLQSISLP